MDITLQLLITQERFGDVVDVVPAIRWAKIDSVTGNYVAFCNTGNPGLALLHVKNCPLSIDMIKEMLTERVWDLSFDGFDYNPVVVRQRKIKADTNQIPLKLLDKIRRDRELTIEFEALRNIYREKIITNVDSPYTDVFRPITEKIL